jgi:hypothetical protein
MEGVDYIDAEGADALKKITRASNNNGIHRYRASVIAGAMDVLGREGVADALGAEGIQDDIAAAVALHLSKQPPAVHASDSSDTHGT